MRSLIIRIMLAFILMLPLGQAVSAQTRQMYILELYDLRDKYNALNRHNPFSVIYDDRSKE